MVDVIFQNQYEGGGVPGGPGASSRKNHFGASFYFDAPPDLFDSSDYNNRGPVAGGEQYGKRVLSTAGFQRATPGPGMWLISIHAEYVWPEGVPVAGTYGSLTAKITFSSGSGLHHVLVDAFSSRVQAPADNVDVEVYWEYMGFPPSSGGIQVFPVRGQVTVEWCNGYQPSFAPIKSYWVLNTDDGAAPIPNSVTVPVPPFAVGYNFVPQDPTAVGTSPLSSMRAITGADDGVLPAVIESMARMNQFRALPPQSKQVLLTGAAYPFAHPGRVQFQINT